jgi:hypothetical protein
MNNQIKKTIEEGEVVKDKLFCKISKEKQKSLDDKLKALKEQKTVCKHGFS